MQKTCWQVLLTVHADAASNISLKKAKIFDEKNYGFPHWEAIIHTICFVQPTTRTGTVTLWLPEVTVILVLPTARPVQLPVVGSTLATEPSSTAQA